MKIVALNGLLGYGYSEEALNIAFSEKVDYLGVDAGSTDPGPYYLGSGKSFTDRNAVKRDLALALPKALSQKAPFIIGTAGGAGSERHVHWLKEILLEIAEEMGLHFRLGTVYSDVSQDYVLEKFHAGKIINMSDEMPLSQQAITQSTTIVSQIGIAPILSLLEQKADVILCGRACDTAIYAAYQAGDVDFIDSVPTDEIQNLKDSEEFHIIDNLGTYYVCFNVKSPLFDGKTVEQAAAMRLAFSKLVDRDYIIETVGQCEQKPANAFIPEGMADGNGGVFKANDDAYTYPDAENVGYYAYAVDVEGAIELLKQAGFEFDDNGMLSASTPISFEYLTHESSGHVAIAECIQQDLAAVGITMTIRTCDWNVFLDDRKAGNYDIARNGWIADFNDPINMLEMWTTDSGNNDCQFGR